MTFKEMVHRKKKEQLYKKQIEEYRKKENEKFFKKTYEIERQYEEIKQNIEILTEIDDLKEKIDNVLISIIKNFFVFDNRPGNLNYVKKQLIDSYYPIIESHIEMLYYLNKYIINITIENMIDFFISNTSDINFNDKYSTILRTIIIDWLLTLKIRI